LITDVAAVGFEAHFLQFEAAVRRCLPILGFDAGQTERFLSCNQEIYEDRVISIDLGGDAAVFSRIEGAWKIIYLIPSDWQRRYELVGAALEELKADYLQSNSDARLSHRIDEPVPSHNAYYAGMLPQFGFEMEPRVTMTAPLETLDQIETPRLDGDLREVAFEPGRLPQVIALYEQAYMVRQEAWSQMKRNRFREENREELTGASNQEDRVKTWITVEERDRVIGSCFGSSFRDKLFIEELAILPEYYGRGIGRFLLVRCQQELRAKYGEPNRYFVLDTWRDGDRALKLYHRLGFRPIHYYTDASFINWSAWRPAS
jgi:ribosomal protein S18 acetylase RimI-like enzyme